MSRLTVVLVATFSCVLTSLLPLAARAQGAPTPADPGKPRVNITFPGGPTGNLFRNGQPISLTARIENPGDDEVNAVITAQVSSGFGCSVFNDVSAESIPAKGKLDKPIVLENSERLPKGPYRLEVRLESEKALGYGTTLFSVWDGPLETACDVFGVSYLGPLATEQTWRDLDLFQQAGIGWVRFPVQGWLPQGDVLPSQTNDYKLFVQEAGKRNLNMVAAFTPRVTVDPAVNPAQAEKEYRESLLAAATHYGFKVKFWELLTVKADPAYPELQGIKFKHLAKGREALRAFDKSLSAIYTLDDPFNANAKECFFYGIPGKGDISGFRYNFLGLPETKAAVPSPPRFSLEELAGVAKTSLKRMPPLWVMEYGFEPSKRERLPNGTYQAALIARALLLDRATGIERIFWRHQPGSPYDLPLTTSDGAAQPSLLALRTTLAALQGVTSITPVTGGPEHIQAYMLHYGEVKKKRGKPASPAHAVLVAWSTADVSGMAIKTNATRLTVKDLWGNTIDLEPTSGAALLQVDEFPHFVDLGDAEEVEIYPPFAHFTPARLLLADDGENKMTFEMMNDMRLFTGKLSTELHFRKWPGESEVRSFKMVLEGAYDRKAMTVDVPIPEDAQKLNLRTQLYEINVDIMLGSRRIGYLTLPVWYAPKAGADK